MAAQPNPRDSMKATWLKWDKSQWTHAHKLLARTRARHPEYDENIPVHAKTDVLPYLPQRTQHTFIITHALAPIAVHQLILSMTGWTWLPAWAVYPIYVGGTLVMALRQSLIMRHLGHTYGYLDGDVHERDGIPDVGVKKIALGLYKLVLGRPAMTLLCTYQASVTPVVVMSNPTWWAWLILHAGIYGIVLDFFFYWYHRAMHDVGSLWKYHRTHHLTKHPNPMLSAYADEEQEIGDIFGMPLLAFLSMRFAFGSSFDFYHWWICQAYVIYSETMGHSGVRIWISTPSMTAGLQKYFGVELLVEDHDLHHRKGHRKSFNYGKQTRLWDYLFGTMYKRIETPHVDYTKQAYLPIF